MSKGPIMTTSQAIAILEAERVLQMVGCEGPDSVPGMAWNDYVTLAGCVVKEDASVPDGFSDLHILQAGVGTTDVIFMKECPDADIFAVFPGIPTTDYLVTCYAHVGQHGSCSLEYCADCIEVTDPVEYTELYNELGRVGYIPNVVRKASFTSYQRNECDD